MVVERAFKKLTWIARRIRVGIIRAANLAPRLGRLALIIPPQAEEEEQGASRGAKPQPTASTAALPLLLAAYDGAGPAPPEPRAVGVAPRVDGAAAGVPLLLNDALPPAAVPPPLLGAQAKDGQEAVPEPAHDAAGAQEQEQADARQDADDDAGDGAGGQLSRCAAGRHAARAAGAGTRCAGLGAGGLGSLGGCGAAGDAVRGAVLGGDDPLAGADHGGVSRSSAAAAAAARWSTSSAAPTSAPGVGHALSLVGAVLPAGAADVPAGDLAGALGGLALLAGGGGGGRVVGAVGAGEGLGDGPGGGVPCEAAAAGGSGAAGDAVAGVALGVFPTAVLVVVAAVLVAAASHEVAETGLV